MEFIKTYKTFKLITEKLSPSEFKTIDGLLSGVSSYINDTLGHKEWARLGNEDKGDVINTAIGHFSAENSSDKKLTNLVKKKANDIIDYLVASLSESLVNEGKWSNIMKGVRKGSKSGPWSIVSIEDGKVVNQELVDIMDAIPAHYEAVKKKFPKAKMSIEDSEGLSVYNESLNEGFSEWEMSFAPMILNGVKLDPKNVYKVKARSTVEAIKKASKEAGLSGNDWMATVTNKLEKIK